MRPDNIASVFDAPTGTSQRAGQTVRHLRRSGHLTDKPLARHPEQQGPIPFCKNLQGAEQLQIMFERFAEPNTYVQYYTLCGNSESIEFRKPLRKKLTDLNHYVAVSRILLHGLGCAL